MAKRNLKSYSISKKMEILTALDRKELTRKEIMQKYELPSSTLSTFIKNRADIEKAYTSSSWQPSRKRLRLTSHDDMETKLYDWFKQARAMNVPVSSEILAEKAVSLCEEMGITDFTPSKGWLQRFRARKAISFRVVSGEAGSVSDEVVNWWTEETLPKLLQEYAPRDIFNADETGLFYRCLPTKTLALKGERCSGGKQSKERITVLLCCNMDGSEKLPALVIGKSAKPKCFKNIKTYPVEYEANAKSWMTSSLFEGWLKRQNRRFQLEGRHICLFIDNCPAHPKVELSNIRLVFMPPNTTSKLQPCDQGIIHNFKVYYRRIVMQRLILHIESQKDEEAKKMAMEKFPFNLIHALQATRSAWSLVAQETVANCFRHAGFVAAKKNGEEEEAATTPVELPADDTILGGTVQQLQTLGFSLGEASATDITTVDDELHTTGLLSTSDIIAAGPSSQCQSDAEEEEEDDCAEDNTPPTVSEARKYAAGLLQFVMSKANVPHDAIECMMKAAQYVETLATRDAKQTTIHHFFKKV